MLAVTTNKPKNFSVLMHQRYIFAYTSWLETRQLSSNLEVQHLNSVASEVTTTSKARDERKMILNHLGPVITFALILLARTSHTTPT